MKKSLYMKVSASFFLLGLSFFLMTSCSKSGKWDDDTKNWSRAFNGQTPPDDVEVVRSRYSRSPHFTYEAYYYFELKTPQQFLEAWISSQNLTQTPPASDNLGLLPDKPTWFIPKEIESYDMWRPADDQYSYFRIFRDRETDVIFVTDSE